MVELTREGKIGRKPVLTCWLGEHTARAGRLILQDAGIASFETPADAAKAVSYLSEWSRAQRALMRTPSSSSEDTASDREAVLAHIQAGREGRPANADRAGSQGGDFRLRHSGARDDRRKIACRSRRRRPAGCSRRPQHVVVKLLSKAISHKSDIGGVVLNIATAAAAGEAARSIEARVRKHAPEADIEGYAVQPMVVRKQAQELILGMNRDPIFGPTILFGAGGVAVEVMDDTAIALPPLDDVLAGDLIERTRIGRLLAGFRDRQPADRGAIMRRSMACRR